MEPYPELAKELGEWEYRLESARLARTRVTERMRSPVAIGWVHPAVLLPEGCWAEQAASEELPVGAMGIGRSQAQIIRRIEMLLCPPRSFRSSGTGWTFAAGFTTAVGLVTLLTLTGPVVIRARSADEPQFEPEAAVIVAGPAELNALVDVVMPLVNPVEPPAVGS